MTPAPRVLLIGAMQTELGGLIRAFTRGGPRRLLDHFPLWTGQGGGCDIAVLQTHVGETNAAIATPEAIRQFQPDEVYKIGCVGGHTAGVHRGDYVLPRGYFHSGAWISRSRSGNAPTPDASLWQSTFGDLPYQVNEDNLGGRPHLVPPEPHLSARIESALRRRGIAPASAYVGGSNMWFFDKAFMRQVLPAQVPSAGFDDPWVADMESYAIAQACAICGAPFSGLYRVSNSEYHGEPYQPDAVAALFDAAFITLLTAVLAER